MVVVEVVAKMADEAETAEVGEAAAHQVAGSGWEVIVDAAAVTVAPVAAAKVRTKLCQ